MNNSDIRNLLNKYWETETSLEEEKILKDYFASDQVSEEFQEFAPLFGFYRSELSMTSELNEAAGISLLNKQKKSNIIFLRKAIVGVAAAGLIALSVFWMKSEVVSTDQFADGDRYHEVEDPEEALRITKEALAFLSVKFDKSSKKINKDLRNIKSAQIFK